jgi:hypothetical protein
VREGMHFPLLLAALLAIAGVAIYYFTEHSCRKESRSTAVEGLARFSESAESYPVGRSERVDYRCGQAQ